MASPLKALAAALNTLLALPSVVVGLVVYLLLSRAGPLGHWGILFTPTAMVIAQSLLVVPLFNKRAYIGEAIASLAAQEQRPDEIVRRTHLDRQAHA